MLKNSALNNIAFFDCHKFKELNQNIVKFILKSENLESMR